MIDQSTLLQMMREAAELVKVLPEHLQSAAFNRVFDAMIQETHPNGGARSTPPISDSDNQSPSVVSKRIDADRVGQLLQQLDRTRYAEIQSGKLAVELVLRVLQAAEQNGVEWLLPSEIARILRDKFRIRIADSSIRMALGRAGSATDRRPVGSGFEYRVMQGAERYLSEVRESSGRSPSPLPGPVRTAKRTKRASAKSSKDVSETASDDMVGAAADTQGAQKRTRKAGIRPRDAIEDLLTRGFFETSRTIRDISSYLQERRALSFASNELSPALVRMVRDGRLERASNSDGQYAYTALPLNRDSSLVN
jgi:hypothetical protein